MSVQPHASATGPARLLAGPVVPPWPLDPADVARWLQLDPSADDEAVLALVAAAATEYAQRARVDRWAYLQDGSATFTPDASTYQGAVMFAAREYRRRNTPSGLQSFGDAGVSYVSRWDVDIDRALRVGQFTPPGVG